MKKNGIAKATPFFLFEVCPHKENFELSGSFASGLNVLDSVFAPFTASYFCG